MKEHVTRNREKNVFAKHILLLYLSDYFNFAISKRKDKYSLLDWVMLRIAIQVLKFYNTNWILINIFI